MRRRRGFTLLELVVVLVILAITAGAAVPAYLSRQSGSAEHRAAGQLAALLIRARLSARQSGASAAVVLSPSDGRFWLTTRDSLASGAIALPNGLHFDESLPARTECRFEPSGSASPCAVRIQRYTVRVDQWSGEVRVDLSPRGSERSERVSGSAFTSPERPR